MAQTKHTYLENAELANYLAQTTLSPTDTILQTVVSNATTLKHTLKSVFFPLLVLLELMASLFLLIKFIRSDNKNLGNSAGLILSIITTILTLTALSVFFAGAYPMLIGILLLSSIAIGILYNGSLFLYSFYRYLTRPSDLKANPLKAVYRANSKKYGIATLLGLAVFISFIASALLVPYLAPVLLIASGILGALAVLVGCAYKCYMHIKTSETHANDPYTKNVLMKNSEKHIKPQIPSDHLTDHLISHTENTRGFEYYTKEHRYHQLTNNLPQNREFLLNQIFEKIHCLDEKINHNHGKLGERLWKQEEKRMEKIELLIYLAVFMLPIDQKNAIHVIHKTLNKVAISAPMQEKLIAQHALFNKNHPVDPHQAANWRTSEDFSAFTESFHANKAFQSFFKNISDVKDIYEAVHYHFHNERLIKLEIKRKEIQRKKDEEEQLKEIIEKTHPEPTATTLPETHH
jgi:hypothetical protein